MEYQARAQQALSLVTSGRYDKAVPLLRELLRLTYVVDFEYDDWLRGLADACRALKNPVPAGYIYLYLHYFDMAFECFQQADSPLDLALCEEVRGDYKRAAELYRANGRPVRASINLERLGDWEQAARSWDQTLAFISPTEHPWPHALAAVNLALASLRINQPQRARDLFVRAIQTIESLAAEWEGYGFLDESLNAYHVLCLIGQAENAFENLAEGYCNAIRLLREQGQTYRVFRYYAAICKYGENLGEEHAVATLHREAADYAVRTGTLYQTFYLRQAAEAYLRVATQHSRDGGFIELAENAYLAAIDAYNQMNDTPAVERCYQALARLDLDEERLQRYKRLAAETSTLQHRNPEVFPPSRLLLTPPELPAVWRDELLDWEAGDQSTSVLTGIVWNLEYGDVARRNALNLLLYHLDLRGQQRDQSPALLKEIAAAMGGLRYNIAYKTLRRLVESEHHDVRAQVMTSAGRMGHPKGLVLIELGLVDKHADVRKAALEALRQHTYPEAFDHLTRLYQDHAATDVRQTLLLTLAHLASFEAAEFFFGLLRADADGDPALSESAHNALRRILNAEWRAVLAARLNAEPEPTRRRLQAALAP